MRIWPFKKEKKSLVEKCFHKWELENIVIDSWKNPDKKERIVYYKCSKCGKTKDHYKV